MSKLNPIELAAAALRDPLVFGISYVDLLDGKQWSIHDRRWMIEPYQAVNPYAIGNFPLEHPRKVVFTKSTQAGISTLSITKALHFLCNWEVRVGYMLPRQRDILDFSSTRLTPILSGSEYLRSRRGDPDSVYTKKIGSSYIFFLEGSVEPRSMPMDALYLDELDLCDPDHVGTAINRLDASPWQLLTYLSTPTLPNYGIDAQYQTSDMREWLVRCPKCEEKQPLDWEKNVRILGPQANPTRVYFGCIRCDQEITLPDIQKGEWVPQQPSLSMEMRGYHISQMMTTPAPKLYSLFRDPATSTSEFYRKRLGRPYTMAGGSLEREDLLVHCFHEPYGLELIPDGRSAYFLGVDQGNQLQAVVAKVEPGKRTPRIVHVELIPFEEGFERVAQLMVQFKIRKAVIDGDPNRHPVKDLQKQFPGRILMADYVEQRERFLVKKHDQKVATHVTINRTEAFDDLVASIRKDVWGLPGDPSNLSPQVETLIEQVTSIKRDIEKRKTLSGEEEVAVWRKLRADHLAHAWLYAKTAIDVDRGRAFRAAVIGESRSSEANQEKTPVEPPYQPAPEIIPALIAHFAEVPKDQLRAFLSHSSHPDYQLGFPLDFKLATGKDRFGPQDILWAVESLAKA